MDSKQYNILLAVVIFLVFIFFLVKLILSIYKNNSLNKNVKFPPWPSKCPDYWQVVDSSNENLRCKNVHKIGRCNTTGDNIKDFSEEIYQGSKGSYYKCNWASKCRVPWEGVDNIC